MASTPPIIVRRFVHRQPVASRHFVGCQQLAGLGRHRIRTWSRFSFVPLVAAVVYRPSAGESDEEGLKNNADVQTARLKVEEAAASLHASKAANLPSLSLGADGKLSSFDGSSPSKTYNLGPVPVGRPMLLARCATSVRSRLPLLATPRPMRRLCRRN